MRYLILLAALLLINWKPAVKSFQKKAEEDKPNIILIMADDMGFSDIGCYGGEISTPNIDGLAKEGIRFNQFYNNAFCSPTRASLITGLYPQQAGMGDLANPRQGPPGPYQGYLNNYCVTLAEVLKQAGYYTAMSGKWHLGEAPAYWPLKRGFDNYFGLISGAANYFDITKTKGSNVVRHMALEGKPYFPPKGFYMTDAITNYAVKILKQQKIPQQPFFLYVAYTAPHWPLQALAEDIAKYKNKYKMGWDSLRLQRYFRLAQEGIIDEKFKLPPRDAEVKYWKDLPAKKQKEMISKMAVYAAQIDRMDQGIGKILNQLQLTGKEKNTIVIFLSDNGGCAEGGIWGFDKRHNGLPPGGVDSYMSYGQSWANASNTPFRFYKKWLHEGGISTPFIVRWPAVIKQDRYGKIINQIGHVTDIMPTLCEASGAQYPKKFKGNIILPQEGQSILPAIKQGVIASHKPIYWSLLNGHKAMLADDYKLVSLGGDNLWELYNLKNDRTELHNLATAHPDMVNKYAAMWNQWAQKVGVFTGRPKKASE